MTAQDNYKLLLNNYISPALRSRGFKGSGGKYQLPHAQAFVQIGFQKNKWNSEELVEFTVNISVIGKHAWQEALKREPWMGETPSSTSDYPLHMWSSRLSQIRRFGGDKWWRIDTMSDLEAIAADVIGRIDEDALPAIGKQTALL
jgi:hypothetical protein